MGLLNLSAEKPTPGSLGDANQIANAFTEIEAAVNSIDESNFATGKIFDTTKIKQGGAAIGQALVWDGTNWVPGGSSPVGAVLPWVGTGAQVPTGFLLCDGVATVLRSSPLGVLLAGRFGLGNNVDTYNVPNLKGRIPAGLDSAQAEFNGIGTALGEKVHALTVPELASHSHTQKFEYYSNLSPSALGGNTLAYNAYGIGTLDAGAINPTGSSVGHNNLQPYLVVNYIIKT